MWFYHLWQQLFSRLERLDFYQVALLTIVIVAIGVYCLRGFGSRSSY